MNPFDLLKNAGAIKEITYQYQKNIFIRIFIQMET